MFAWHGKMLVVDLSSGRVRTEVLPESTLGTWLGGRGLGISLMRDYASLDPFDETMPLFFCVGPLCGTGAPASARLSIVSRSPLTGTVLESSAGGAFPIKLKQAGFDAVMITGKAQDPVRLEIVNGRASVKEASWLWGQGCIEVQKRLQDDGEVACIGPAGERLSRIASILVDGTRSTGRGGLGAVMGAKNLKAVVVDGSAKTGIADEAQYREVCYRILGLLRDSPAVQGLREYGTSAFVDDAHRLHLTPTENFRKTLFPLSRLYTGASLRRFFGFKTEECATCPVQCRHLTNCNKPIPGYDTLSHFGALNDNPDAESLVRANILCNNMGLDTVSTAATIAAYGEARGEFLICDDILDMVRTIAYREGEGDALAEGSKRYCASIGRPALSMTVKGLELPACDPRGSAVVALALGLSARGAWLPWPSPMAVSPSSQGFDGAAEVVKGAEDMAAAVDSLAACRFAFMAASLEQYASLLAAATGMPCTAKELLRTGEAVVRLEREYNRRNGFTRDDDLLPERFFSEPGTPGDGISVLPIDKKQFVRERDRYYRLRGEKTL